MTSYALCGVLFLGFYLAICGYISYKSLKKVKAEEDFFVGGGRVGLASTAIGYSSTLMSKVMVSAQTAYTVGFSGIWYTVLFSLNSLMIILIIAGPFKKTGYLTITEYICKRYSFVASLLGGTCIVIQLVLASIIPSLTTMGGIFSVLTSFKLFWGVCFAATISLMYVLFSGWLSTVYTNILHFIIGCTVMISALVQVIIKFHGIPETISCTSLGIWNPFAIGINTIVTTAIIYIINSFSAAIAIQTIASSRKTREAKLAFLIGGVGLVIIMGVLGTLMGVTARIICNENIAIIGIIKSLFITSDYLGVILSMGLFISLLPSITSALISTNTIIVRDIYANIKKYVVDRQILLMSRVMMIPIMILAVIGTLIWHEQLMEIGLLAFTLRNTTLLPLILFGMFWPKGNNIGAVLSIISTMCIVIFWYLFRNPFNIHPLYPGLFVSIVVYIIASLFKGKESKNLFL